MDLFRQLSSPLKSGGLPLGTKIDSHPFAIALAKKEMNLAPELRRQNPHFLIIGDEAKGKTRLLASLITQDIKSRDRAVVVIDNDGILSACFIHLRAKKFEHSQVKDKKRALLEMMLTE
ncbi:MAG: type IV secretion system DNA-binding domain-containing protein [Candidatus Obscuribacterales bacterium]|nr:type IV secretion system DNA-binding domain-containing protein [Candidatus Obscuribacterales bacterium]